MNRSNFEHAAWALLFQIITAIITGSWLAGALVGAAFFLGREHAQRQATLARAEGLSVKDLNPWEGFDFGSWSRDSQLDLLMPVVAVSLVVLIEWGSRP